jgi:hypothetical protein
MPKSLTQLGIENEPEIIQGKHKAGNRMSFLASLYFFDSRFPVRCKQVAGIDIAGGFDTNILGLVLILSAFQKM